MTDRDLPESNATEVTERLAAVLAADIAGYSRLRAGDGWLLPKCPSLMLWTACTTGIAMCQIAVADVT